MSSDFTDAAESVGDLRDGLGDSIEEAVDDGMDDTKDQTQRNIRAVDAVARPVLINALQRRGGVYLPGNVVADEEIQFPWWAEYVDKGTGERGDGTYPSADPMPPYEPILRWVVSKPVIPEEYSSQYELARAIQQSIGEQGTKPKPFVRRSWFWGKNHIEARAWSAFRRETRRHF